MSLISRFATVAARVARDIAEAPEVARQLRQRRAGGETPQTTRRPVEVEIDPNDVPDVADIEAAAREYEQARTEGNAASRLKRRAERILKRVPNGTHGAVTVERVESNRMVIDADAVRELFKAHGLGEVPQKQCSPSLVVTIADDIPAAPEQHAPVLAAA
ncbi:tRNA-dihydrouridine synthase [Lipingzhangella halophila]|uniref:tRNA-dihydrouridine synthase n=1 Tax=Lipingzhangella halophila TaxID=1783352 RepID=A0A7W7RGT9_9ACTN|nr:hypothetical protein [Lipingzhangella halophila]MBB4931388.1 tRNA-dihydrouridine synthase [Lipingzhangella halophila]